MYCNRHINIYCFFFFFETHKLIYYFAIYAQTIRSHSVSDPLAIYFSITFSFPPSLSVGTVILSQSHRRGQRASPSPMSSNAAPFSPNYDMGRPGLSSRSKSALLRWQAEREREREREGEMETLGRCESFIGSVFHSKSSCLIPSPPSHPLYHTATLVLRALHLMEILLSDSMTPEAWLSTLQPHVLLLQVMVVRGRALRPGMHTLLEPASASYTVVPWGEAAF